MLGDPFADRGSLATTGACYACDGTKCRRRIYTERVFEERRVGQTDAVSFDRSLEVNDDPSSPKGKVTRARRLRPNEGA